METYAVRSPRSPRLPEDGDRPLRRDERLVVRRDHRGGAALDSESCELRPAETSRGGATAWGSRMDWEVNQFWQYEQCRSQPSIPKERASEPGSAWKKRFLLDRVALDRTDVTPGELGEVRPRCSARGRRPRAPPGSGSGGRRGGAASAVRPESRVQKAQRSRRHRSPREDFGKGRSGRHGRALAKITLWARGNARRLPCVTCAGQCE